MRVRALPVLALLLATTLLGARSAAAERHEPPAAPAPVAGVAPSNRFT